MDKSDLVSSINEIRRISKVSNSSPFLRNFSLNSSSDSSVLKRKLDDSDQDSILGNRQGKIVTAYMSPWECRKLRADLIDSQSQIVRLEDRIDQLHKNNKEAVILFDQEKSELRTHLDASRRSIETLERKLQKLRTREIETREELNEVKRSSDSNRLDRDQRLLELEDENAQLQERLLEIEIDKKDNGAEAKLEVQDLEAELRSLQLKLEESEELAQTAQSKLVVALEDCRDAEQLRLELLEAQNQNKILESERDEWEEARTVATVLQDRVLKLQEIEKELTSSREEVGNLKLAVQNKVFMEEKLHDLELKQKITAGREDEFIKLKEQNFDLETEVERWEEMVQSYCGGKAREELRNYLTDLNDKQITYTMDINSLQAELNSATLQIEAAQSDLSSARKAADEMQSLVERLRTEGQLLRRKVALVRRERDSYRQQLDLFEKDLTVSGIGSNACGDGGQQDRVKELEEMLEGYRGLIEGMENELSIYKSEDAEARIQKMKDLEIKLSEVRAECEQLRGRRDELEEMLEKRVLGGGYISPSTKVLHFRNNPFNVAEEQQKAEIEQLRSDCDRLKARVRLLEAGERLDLTVRTAADIESGTHERVKQLEEELKSSKLKNTRLKEVFKQTSQDFRDVSYMLLGYRIDLVSNKLYKLTNMYSENPNDYFMFQTNRSGLMEMLETPYTESFPELVNEHLHENSSVPCFLSAVTLGLHANEANPSEGDEADGNEEESEREDDDDVEEEEEDEEEAEGEVEADDEPIEISD